MKTSIRLHRVNKGGYDTMGRYFGVPYTDKEGRLMRPYRATDANGDVLTYFWAADQKDAKATLDCLLIKSRRWPFYLEGSK